MSDRNDISPERTWSPGAPLRASMGVSAETAFEAVAAPPQAGPRVASPKVSRVETVTVATAADELAEHTSSSGAGRNGFTVEATLYLLMLVAAILSRFWDLSFKALHHDESLHAYYSWEYAVQGGYRHHPLMHGPFLFHANALVYLLFGASDATSRYMPALFGVIIVGLPYFLRGARHLGRWGALSASFLFLVSPTILYQSRYIRHDIYTVAGALLLFISIVRYIDKPERRWLVVGASSTAFLLTNHEIIFAILAIFGAYLYGALAWERGRVWWHSSRRVVYRLIALHASAVLLLLWLFLVVPQGEKDRIVDIPWNSPSTSAQFDYYRGLLSNPLFMGALAIVIAFCFGLRVILSQARDAEREEEGWLGSLTGDADAGSVSFGVRIACGDRAGLGIAIISGLAIFVILYTSVFTNLYGLVSSTVATNGTLLYWLGQHDYRRGEQPWYYFGLLLPQYEFIAVLLGGAMAVLTVVRAIGGAAGWWSGGRGLFFRLFLVTWFVFIFVGLSYAGEKMPWLIIHIAEPLILLAAALMGGLIERGVEGIRVRRRLGRGAPGAIAWPEWGIVATLVLAAAAWFVVSGRLTAGRIEDAAQTGEVTRSLTSFAADRWWWLAIPPLAALAVVAVASLVRGTRRTGFAALVSLAAVLTLLQIHGGWRLSYAKPDVPIEMMIYTQTSTDVNRVMGEIGQLSEQLTGGKDLKVWYDSGVSWPFQWYLRDFPNKRYIGSSMASSPEDADIVLVSVDRDGSVARNLTNYTAQEYVLRWWFPEEMYRDFALAPELPAGRSAWKSADDPHGPIDIVESALDSSHTLLEAEGQLHLYRMLMYRELEDRLGQYNFKVYVRNDLLPLWNEIHY